MGKVVKTKGSSSRTFKRQKSKTTNVDVWLKKETTHIRAALEKASKRFDKQDMLTVNTLEAIYGRESSFGDNRRTRGMVGAAGDFHLIRATAKEMGLNVTEDNDERFDIDQASAAAAKYLKKIDRGFSKKTILDKDLVTIQVKDPVERKLFTIAAYNGGPARIAKAQSVARKNGKDPTIWDDVKEYLRAAGAIPEKVKEIQDYVDKVLEYDAEFSRKSKADKAVKFRAYRKIKSFGKGHWITKDRRHIFIEDKRT